MDMGLDSLMAVQLRNSLRVGLGLKHKLPATIAFDCPTIEALADYFVPQVLGTERSPMENVEHSKNDGDQIGQITQEIEKLPDDEVEAMLIRKLDTLQSRTADV